MKNFILFIFCAISLSSYAQRRKAVFVEAAGNGLLLTANYDMRFKPNQNDGWGFRAGIGGWSFGDTRTPGESGFSYLSIPVGLNYIVGKKSNGFEGGLGVTPFYMSSQGFDWEGEFFSGDTFNVMGFINVGYRYQPVKKGLLFRASWTPIIAPGTFGQNFVAGWAGLSLGYSFR